MELVDSTSIWGGADERTLAQIKTCAKTAAHIALMADNHVGYALPIGGVVAYEGKISPSSVGFDIACGNNALRIDMPDSEVRANIKTILDDVWKGLEIGIGRTNDTRVEHDPFDDETWKLQPMKSMKQMAHNQLGTIGSGNHYVDLFADEAERVWIGAHFGSRGLGHKTATHFLKEGHAPSHLREPSRDVCD